MDAPKISVPETQRAGVWANYAVVSHSPHEFTLDFVRVDHSWKWADLLAWS